MLILSYLILLSNTKYQIVMEHALDVYFACKLQFVKRLILGMSFVSYNEAIFLISPAQGLITGFTIFTEEPKSKQDQKISY